MSNEKKTEEKLDKVMTKYERKLEKRKVAEEEEKRSWKNFKIGFSIVAAVLVVVIIGSIASSAYGNYAALHRAYITIGDHELNEVEYDYYFNNAVNSYLGTYGSYAAMFGLDTTLPLDQQQYTEEMTWEDYFAESAALEARRVKAMVDDAAANGYTYDDTEDIKAIESQIESEAASYSWSVTDYYVASYGEYATPERIEPFLKENILASAYHTYLVQQQQPSEEELQARYEENKMAYDLIDCRHFYFAADVDSEATEEEKAAAMEDLKVKADEFVSRREAGEEFETLCAEYAPEDEKANYGGETEGSLVDDGRFYEVPTQAANWLYDEARAAGELTVIEDTTNSRWYVVEFLERSNNWEETSASISNSIAESAVNEYEAALEEKYEVKEGRGKLVYLSIPEETETAEETEAAE